MTTLKQLLTVQRFSDLKILNKKADLSREIDTIEISETPDVDRFIPKNTLLLTTGILFKNNPEELSLFITKLANLPSAGLAIKLDRFIDTLDEQVLATADELNFPLLLIPAERTLGTLSHQLLSYLWSDQTEEIFYSLEIQEHFTKLMMTGASIETLVNELGQVTKQSTLLIDPLGQVIHQNFTFSSPRFEKEEGQRLIELVQEKTVKKEIEAFIFEGSFEDITVNICPLESERYFPYKLVLLETAQLPYPFSKFAIKQAISVLSLTIHKENHAQNKRKLETKRLLNYLLREDQNEEQPFMNYPMLQSDFYQIISIKAMLPQDLEENLSEIDALMYDYLLHVISKNSLNVQLFPTKNNNQWVLLNLNDIDLSPIFSNIHHFIASILPVSVMFSLGHSVNTLDLLHFSYKESLKVFAEVTDTEEFILFKPLDGIKKITDYAPNDAINYFCISILKSLAYPKNTTDDELRRTLLVYLNNQCEMTKTAEDIFVHRNTVKYRLKKCQELFSQNITDPEFSLQLRVALALSE